MILVIAAVLDYEGFMRDLQMAFLNADVEEDISEEMVRGYEIAEKSGVPFFMKRKKC